MDSIKALINSPVGPKTIQFWAPAANWCLVLAAIADANKPAERISPGMTTTLFFYSGFFMRFAWRVQLRNLLLFSCHFSNASMQLYLLMRRKAWEAEQKAKETNLIPVADKQ